MSRELEEPLRSAIDAMRNASVSDESLRRSLAGAAQIVVGRSPINDPPTPPRYDGRRGRDPRRWSVAAPPRRSTAPIAAALLCMIVAGISAMFFFSGRTDLAFADVCNAMEDISSVHLMIRTEADGEVGPVEIWYRRGVGFAMQSALGREIDDGANHWDYSPSQNLVVRSKSRLGDAGYRDVTRLGKAMGFYIDDVPSALPRMPEKDRTLNGDRCAAYVWQLQEELLPDERVGQPDGLASGRRVVFLIDQAQRIRRCDYERGLDSKWKSYRSVDVSYTDDIPADRFAASFGENVRIVDAAAPARDHGAEGLDPDVARLDEGAVRRHSTYEGLRFTLSVTTEEKRSPTATYGDGNDPRLTNGVLQARDVFAILGPKGERSARRWRYWQREVKDDAGQWKLDRYVAFNGSQTNTFERRPGYDRRPRDRVAPAGSAVPWEAWHDFEPNHFDSFLFLYLNGLEDRVVLASDELRYLHLGRFHVVGRRQSNGQEVLTLLGKSTAEFGVEYRVEITGAPDFCILRWEARNARDKNELLGVYEVKELAEFQGNRYPAKGSYRQVAIGELNDVWYEFEVLSVEALPDDAREHWLPSWPPSTVVTDQAKGDESAASQQSAAIKQAYQP